MSLPSSPQEPLDPAWLAQMANAMFGALPVAASGMQAPGNTAPPGSPLASPAGLSAGVPGSPIPQGLVHGANLVPESPSGVLSLGNRAPSMVPAASAGNGVPDSLYSAIPAYEPRLGSGALGVAPVPVPPGSSPASARDAGAIASRYLPAPERSPGAAVRAPADGPQYYFLDVAGIPGAHVTPPAPATRAPLADRSPHGVFDVHAVRRDFPTLQEHVNGHPLVWFDNAATTHKPQAVIDRLARFYAEENSNIHRAAHAMAGRATDAYEAARETVRRFINAPDVDEVIFLRGTTEAINLVAHSWGTQHIGPGDEVVVSHLEHHANIVPWQQLATRKGARLRVIPVDDSGQVRMDEFGRLLNDRTKLVAVTQVSNALGTVTPVREMAAMARRHGARVLVDGAQSMSHMPIDVQDLGADFFVFSGHKVFGPTGIGALWGKRAVLEDMPPWQGGGNMIADVTFEKTVYQAIPNKFEAGTGNIADAVGLGAALDYVSRIGMDTIARYEHDLLAYGMRELARIRGVRMIGTAADKASVMSFVLAGYSTEEVGSALNEYGIAVRAGHHCAQPILRRFGVESTVRPSLAFYNTFDEIDRLVQVVRDLSDRRRAG